MPDIYSNDFGCGVAAGFVLVMIVLIVDIIRTAYERNHW